MLAQISVLIICIISLIGRLSAANSPDQPPGTSQQLAVCLTVNGQPVPGEVVYWESHVNSGSGGHSHTSARPKGSFNTPVGNELYTSLTGYDGCSTVNWYAPNASGAHSVFAYTVLGGNTSLIINVWVNPFTGWLFNLPSGPDYNLVGSTGDHPDNHWGTGNVVLAMQLTMRDFRARTGLVGNINDIGLPWGGTFDLGPGYATLTCPAFLAQYWWNTCAHGEHRLGRNVDVPTAPLGNSANYFPRDCNLLRG